MRTLSLALILAIRVHAEDVNPVTRVWRVNPQAAAVRNPALRAVLPEVHSVTLGEKAVLVESAGLALQPLSPLDVNVIEPALGVRKFGFEFPLAPMKAAGSSVATPYGVVGAFVNGVPLYNVASSVSWRDQNLWHQDAVAGASISPLVQSLLAGNGRHSPLIGYALDGFPIYGPWGFDAAGGLRRFRSGHRLRPLVKRDVLPDGTSLGPSQEGPPVSALYPAGTFVEDYEFVPGAGDLDEHNGRLGKTPEYPQGTYAYFLATDAAGRMAYPYLVGGHYYGEVRREPPSQGRSATTQGPITLWTSPFPSAGQPEQLTFAITNSQGKRVRFPERVHEKPIHLLVVSKDLREFAHIHPELQPDDTFAVAHRFAHGGQYWLYADYTMPGQAQSISRFLLNLRGPERKPEALVPDTQLTKSGEGLQVRMIPPAAIRSGQDLSFRFEVADEESGAPVTDLEPYLGAWAHVMIVSGDGRRFIHAHPLDDAATPVAEDPWKHSHVVPGPSPSSVTTITGFDSPGLHRLWVQFQRGGKVIAIPFTFQVQKGRSARPLTPTADAIRVEVTRAGFSPARIAVPAGKPFRLAFERRDAENCASSVVFPELSMKKDLPAGTTTVVDLPALKTAELSFSCGMKMYRGAVVAR